MLSQEENELLCRVEGTAPAGEMMRRYWLPALLSEEVAEPDGTPVRAAPGRPQPRRLPRLER